jgi:hypothetical protein
MVFEAGSRLRGDFFGRLAAALYRKSVISGRGRHLRGHPRITHQNCPEITTRY